MRKGFLVLELIIACAIFMMVMPPIMSLSTMLASQSSSYLLREGYTNYSEARKYLANAKYLGTTTPISNGLVEASFGTGLLELFAIKANLAEAFGSNTCELAWKKEDIDHLVVTGSINIASDNVATDLWARNGLVYISADSAVQNKEDLVVVDVHDSLHPQIISKIQTGPGIRALALASHFLYAANLSSTAQLQIIDVADVYAPKIISSLKLPVQGPSIGLGSSILYYKNYIFLGTTKSDGPELHVIDVRDPYTPKYIQGMEIGTQVNSILAHDDVLYIVTPQTDQIRIFEIGDGSIIRQTNAISLPVYAQQESKKLYRDKNDVFVGRSVGGFHNTYNHELLRFSLGNRPEYPVMEWSADVGSSINGIAVSSTYVVIATPQSDKELQVWNMAENIMVKSFDLPAKAISLRCDGNQVYVGLESSDALKILHV